jgi:hypothetical protein
MMIDKQKGFSLESLPDEKKSLFAKEPPSRLIDFLNSLIPFYKIYRWHAVWRA